MFVNIAILRAFRALIAILLFALTFTSASPALANGLTPNPAAEAYLLNELRSTGFADLAANFAEQDRGIRGEALVTALTDSEVLSHPGLAIIGATVTDDLIAVGLTLPGALGFSNTTFTGNVNLSDSQIESFFASNSTFMGDLEFTGSSLERMIMGANSIAGYLLMHDVEVSGNAELRSTHIEQGIVLTGTQIGKDLVLDASELLGTTTEHGSYPANLGDLTVNGSASFYGVKFAGETTFADSHFGNLDLSAAVFSSPVHFVETTVDVMADFVQSQFLQEAYFTNFSTGSDVNFNQATFALMATFESATIGRDANFNGATFNDRAVFDYFTVGRFVDFSDATFGGLFQFYYTTVSYPYFENTVFNGPVTFEGMQVNQDFELVKASYNHADAPFIATFVDVDGAVTFTDFTTSSGLQLSESHFGSLSIRTKDDPAIQFIDLTGTDIDDDLLLDKVNAENFLAEGLSVGGSTTLYHVTIAGELDMRNANIGFLKVDDQFTPPTDSRSFNLRGMTYSDIDLGDQGLTENTWRSLLNLVNDSAYSPQA